MENIVVYGNVQKYLYSMTDFSAVQKEKAKILRNAQNHYGFLAFVLYVICQKFVLRCIMRKKLGKTGFYPFKNVLNQYISKNEIISKNWMPNGIGSTCNRKKTTRNFLFWIVSSKFAEKKT